MADKKLSVVRINEEGMKGILDSAYKKALSGLPVSKSVENLAKEYTDKYPDKKIAINKMIEAQVTKCGISGFVTGLGGFITLPVALPANVTSVLYVQLRMIATIAYIGGYDPSHDEVQTLAYLCLAGSGMADIMKKAGIRVGEKITVKLIKNIPMKIIYKINDMICARFITKAGSTGIINLSKMIPFVGAGVGATIDVMSTKIIAANAVKAFIEYNEVK